MPHTLFNKIRQSCSSTKALLFEQNITSMMIETKLTQTVISMSFKFASKVSGFPFKWNWGKTQIEIDSSFQGRQGRRRCFFWIVWNYMLFIFAIVSYLMHMNKFGFQLEKIQGLWRITIFIIGTTSGLFTWAIQSNAEELQEFMNSLIAVPRLHEG